MANLFNKPGETPLDDISGLKVKFENPTRADLSQIEAVNVSRASEKYMTGKVDERNAPFDLPWMMQLHKEMFGDVWSWAGKFRDTNTSIGTDKHNIQMQMAQLVTDLHAWSSIGMPLEEQAMRLHHRAVQIHPFKNGNGRWARMLANIWLRKHGAGIINWPETTEQVSPLRDEYIAALKAADNMDDRPLQTLHKRYWQPA